MTNDGPAPLCRRLSTTATPKANTLLLAFALIIGAAPAHLRRLASEPVITQELSADLTVAHLPPPVQASNRVLVAITAGGIGHEIIVRQLDAYVAACEAGYEVHVVLVTYAQWWDAAPSLFAKSRFACMRLGVDLPVVVWRVTDADGKLAAEHRRVFSALADSYDLYVSHEDDIMVRAAHLDYYVKWEAALRDSGLYPGFAVMEAPVGAWNVSQLYANLPMVWNPFTGHYDHWVQLLQHGSTVFMQHDKPWAPVFVVTNALLKAAASRPAWTLDRDKPWREFNTHFQHLWLARYHRIVIPLPDAAAAYVHHAGNRYVEMSIAADSAKMSHHNYAVETAELAATLAACTHSQVPPTVKPWTLERVTYSRRGASSCAVCLDAGQVAVVDMKFRGRRYPHSSARRASTPHLNVTCLSADSMRPQQSSLCGMDVEAQACEAGF